MVVGSPIVLNLIPGGVMPVMMINETDKGYKKEFLIYNGAAPYNLPANVSATIRGTKRDGYGVTEVAEVTSGSNLVRITVTEQMTAVPGPNVFELVFEDTNNLKVATINFIMMVERSALNANTVISDSDIAYAEQVLNDLQGVAAYGTALDNKIYKFDTVAQMVVDDSLKAGMYARTGGYYAVNDGGGALYRIYSTAPATYYETLSNGLYAKLITDGTISPEMVGAYGDGSHDDSSAFAVAVNTGMMIVCEKTYKITQKIQLKNGVCGSGTIVFRDSGCFTVSIGTTVTGVTFNTANKLLDFTDTDITSASVPNAHANVLFKGIDVVCESGAATLFDLKATTYGFFDMVFKDINVTGQCNKAVNIIATDHGWITQIMFIDCMFGRPLHVCTITKADRVHFERCTSQADDNNKNNLLYDVNNCKMFTIINCFDWDFSYKSDTKLYKFTDCRECVWIGNDRTIDNFDNTIQELMHFFAVLMIGVGYAPAIYNKANVLNSVMDATDETFFQNPTGYGLTLVPIRTGQGVGFRAVNSYSLPYGAYSCDFVVNGQGQIKIRVRVPDPTNPDDQGRNRTKWSDYYTFTPDS